MTLKEKKQESRYQVRTRYSVLISCLHPMSVHCLSSEDKISSSAPLLHLMSIHCLFDCGQDIQFWSLLRLMLIHCLFDCGQDIQFCPSPSPYVNPLPLWLRTRYPILPHSNTLCQSIASLIDDKIFSSVSFLTLMSIHCLCDWGQDIQFCLSPPPYVNPLPLWLRTRYAALPPLLHFMSVHCLSSENKISSSASLLCTLRQSIASLIVKISSSAPLLHLMSIHCLFDWGQDIQFCPLSSDLC